MSARIGGPRRGLRGIGDNLEERCSSIPWIAWRRRRIESQVDGHIATSRFCAMTIDDAEGLLIIEDA
jgi:hypothetical protein